MTNFALIMAAGRGSRLPADLPKQYLPLAGKPVLRHTVDAFLDHPEVDGVAVVISPDDAMLAEAALGDLPDVTRIAGGDSRQESVLNGLHALQGDAPDKVLIHDAARPFVTAEVISGVITALQDHDAALPCVSVTDTLKRGKDGMVADTVDRASLFHAQTPQGFRFSTILPAHQAAIGENHTDDIAIAEQAGIQAVITDGHPDNFKITTAPDLLRARQMVNVIHPSAEPASRTAVGQGFDVHRFAPDRPLILCGVTIPHEQGLAGHSDADVAMHALTDALLGTIGAGDIGQHFPPTDDRWRGAPSETFLRHACDLITRAAGRISQLDLTIICERPKIAPHRAAMQSSLATICGIPADRVSLKATTTEKLGFTGRKEGIACMAIATVILPDTDG